MKTALLLSGGMDSMAIAWWKRPDFGITINYGQLPADAERDAAHAICRHLGIEHVEISVDCRSLGSGDMAGNQASAHAPQSEWWPYRNQLLITLAAMKAISLSVQRLWIGSVSSDHSHCDGRQQFVDSINHLVSMQEGAIIVEAPAIDLSTEELIKVSGIPADLLAWAHSCHKASVACGNCRGCNKYFNVFGSLGYDLDRPRQSVTA